MTEEETMKFCGTITMAARRIGIGGKFDGDDFMWFDPLGHRAWKVTGSPDKKQTLFNACQSLVNYIAPWNPPPPKTS